MSLWDGVDEEVVVGMTANLDTYMAAEAENCKCEGTCKCDDNEWLSAAQMSLDIRPRTW